jgi:diaminopimelate epimerase
MKKISFTKMSGAGNDFILLDKKINPSFELVPDVVGKLCHRRTGIGADGILVIGDHPDYDFTMEYYNSDGSTGTLCGNGARCALWYAQISGRLKNGPLARFLSSDVVYSGEILAENRVKFNLANPKDFRFNFDLVACEQYALASYVHTGSPHVVVNIQQIFEDIKRKDPLYKEISKLPVYDLGREIRYLPEFAPGGTNVNFIDIKDGIVHIRTYERGVEDETLACGTGSVASALICYFNYGLKPPVNLITKNGSQLVVNFEVDENKDVKNVSLSGPAEVTFSGEFFQTMYFK